MPKEPDLFSIVLGKCCDVEILQERDGINCRLCIQDVQVDYRERKVRIVLTPERRLPELSPGVCEGEDIVTMKPITHDYKEYIEQARAEYERMKKMGAYRRDNPF